MKTAQHTKTVSALTSALLSFSVIHAADVRPVRNEAPAAARNAAPAAAELPLERKLDAIILPRIAMEDVPFVAALEFIRKESIANDPGKDPGMKGINIICKGDGGAPVTLALKNVSLRHALQMLAELGGLDMKVEPDAVVLQKQGD